MKTKISFQFLSIITILSMLITMPQPALADGTVIHVPGDYGTIQAAIDAAGSGDTIIVAAGIYHEQITITKPLTVTGVDGAILDGTGLAPQWTTGVKIRSGNVTFNNIDVTNFTQDGITAYDNIDMPNLHITNSKISNIQPGYWGFGIYVGYESEGFGYTPPDLTEHLDFSGLLIEGNEITNVHSSALVIQAITGTPGTLQVRNNYIHDNTTNSGIWVDCARNLLIENNEVVGNKWGVEFSAYAESSNTLNGPYSPKDISVVGNLISNSTNQGIVLYEAWPGTISVTGNTIQGNGMGVDNQLTETLNATNNWWGDTDPSDNISGNVDYSPWYMDASKTTLVPVHNVTKDLYYLTIQAAVDAASAGDTINVAAGTYDVPATINLNKPDLTLSGAGSASTIIQVSGASEQFYITAPGVTINGFGIRKTDKVGNIIYIGASDVSITNNEISGQFVIGDGEVSRAMVFTGGLSGLNISGNTIHNIRQPGYISGVSTGTISNNYVYLTKGWVVEQGNMTFTNNTWGTGANSNVYDIAILSMVGAGYYTDIPAMAAANNGAFIEDQRPASPTLSIVHVDGSVAASGDGTARSPKKTIAEGITRVVAGGTINVAAGTYVENVVINKPLTLAGAGQGNTIIQPAVSNANPCTGSSMCGGAASNVILVQANNVVIHDLTVDGDNPVLTSGIVRTGGGAPADLDARNGIIKNTDVTYNGLEVYNVTVQNIYLRGMYSTNGAFNFHHNTVTNVQGDSASIAMFAWGGPGIMANNTVSYANDAISANHSNGIQFLNNTVTHSGSGIHTDNSGDAGGVADLIQGNTVTDCIASLGGYGIWTFVPYIAPVVNNNTITNCDVGLSAWGQGTAVVPQFTNNVVAGPAKKTGSVGAYITTDLIGWGYTDISVNFSGNVITNYETGVYLTADQQPWNSYPYEAKTINVTFHKNQIFNNTNGVDMGTGGTIVNDFTNNWWGSETGPTTPDNPSGTGDSVASGINFSPWCSNTACTSEPPVLPASFYGEIHINSEPPSVGDKVEAYLPDVTGIAASGAITTYSGNLVYSFDIPGNSATEGDLITFKINGRVVATAIWHSGTHVALNIHPPEALPGGPYVGSEGSAINLSGSADDWGNDAVTYAWDLDNNGSYETAGQTVSYTWMQDGTYTVGLKVIDGQESVDTAAVAVTVNNAAPLVNAGDDFTVAEDVPFNFAGTASDAGTDTLTYEWDFDYDGVTFDVDASGSLTPSHTYAVTGPHTAALRVSDGDTSTTDTVVVAVTNVNDAPVITGQQTLSTDEDVPLTITVGDLLISDPDSTVFTLTVLLETNYTITDTTITPTADFNGVLTVPVTVNDGLADSNIFELTVTVNAINDMPVANPQALTTDEDTPLTIALTGSDVENNSLTYAVTVDPLHGTLSGTAPTLTYTPETNYNGTDSFKFTVNDGAATSMEATISLTIHAVNDAPVITGQVPLSVNEDTSLTINLINLTVTDADNTYPADFTLTVLDGANYNRNGNIITPTQNFHGPLTVQVQVNDGAANSNLFNLAVTVIDVLPTSPNAGGPYTAASGQSVTLTGSATCEPADDCAFTWDLDNDGEYDDAPGSSISHTWYAVGTYTIGMKVTDDDGNFATASATVNILAVTHSVALVPGWNLVSFNVHPTNTSVASVLASISGNYDLVYAWDATGAHSTSGNWLKADNIVYSPDSLTTLDESMGFWIHMTAADVLEIPGSIPTTTTINLSDNVGGWNLVGYPSAANGTLPGILSNNGVGTDFSLVYAYHAIDTTDPWKLYDRTSPLPIFNDLPELTAGWGYWIKVSEADPLWEVQYLP